MSTLRDIVAQIPPHKRELSRYLFQLGISIDEVMKSKGISQGDLAAAIGMKPAQLSKLLTEIRFGIGNPTMKTIARIATALEIDLVRFPVYDEWLRDRDREESAEQQSRKTG